MEHASCTEQKGGGGGLATGSTARSAMLRRAVTSDRPMRGPRDPEESLGVMPTSAVGLAHHGSHEGEEKGPGGHGSSLCWI